MRSVLKFAMILFVVLLLSNCGVTESGNPCPGGDCGTGAAPAQPTSEERGLYENQSYGVTVDYPDTWTLTNEKPDAVTFVSGDAAPHTTAVFHFARPSPVPETLIGYLDDTYPTRTFITYSTLTLQGYFYDNPDTGPNGGDLHDYYFLGGDVLVTVEAEIIAKSRAEFVSLLNGIAFVGN